MLQWWPTGRITAGRKRHFYINRTGAKVEAEAPIIQITNLDLSDVLKISMCSSLLLGDDFLDCNRQWKARGTARENCDFASSEAWVSLSSLPCLCEV